MIIALDFDNTLCASKFPDIGPAVPYAIEVVQMLIKKGHKIILWTVRGSDTIQPALNWCKENNIKLFRVNSNTPETDFSDARKIYYDILIDDRNLGTPVKLFNGDYNVDWIGVYKLLKDRGIL
jgi:hypothetical protein